MDYKIFFYFIIGTKTGTKVVLLHVIFHVDFLSLFLIIVIVGTQGDQYESLYGYWLGQDQEEFAKSLLSSQLLGWGSYLVRFIVLAIIAHSNLWDGISNNN